MIRFLKAIAFFLISALVALLMTYELSNRLYYALLSWYYRHYVWQ